MQDTQDTVERLGLWRTQGVYGIGEAHRLTGVPPNSIKRWLQDYPANIADLKPPWQDGMGPKFTNLTCLSFLELVEILIAGKIRENCEITSVVCHSEQSEESRFGR